MKRLKGWAWILLFTIGCGVQQLPDSNKPKPTPDTPIVSPAESYFKGLAKRVGKDGLGQIQSPQELATLVNQLRANGDLSTADADKVLSLFPGAIKDSKPFADKAVASAKILSLK